MYHIEFNYETDSELNTVFRNRRGKGGKVGGGKRMTGERFAQNLIFFEFQLPL